MPVDYEYEMILIMQVDYMIIKWLDYEYENRLWLWEYIDYDNNVSRLWLWELIDYYAGRWWP